MRIEVWSLPDDPDGFRVLCEPPYLSGTGFQDRADVYGGGQLIVSSDYEHLALIVDVDPSDIETSHSSLVRALQWWPDDESPDGGIWQVVWEFFADEAEEQIQDGQRVVSITGLDVRSAPDDGIVYPREPTNPNWQWGAPNLLENPGFEDSALTSAAFKITVNATAGTYTVTLSAFGTSPAINWNAQEADVAIAIEAITGINDVTVAGDGSDSNPFVIEFLDPANTDLGTISIDSSGLTGLASPETITVGGAPSILPWTRSFNPSNGLYHGTYNFFGADQTHVRSGLWSLKVDADLGDWPGSWPGAMQIVSVNEGDHWGTPWVWPQFNARYRFGLRTVDDTWLATVEADLTAGSWQSIPLVDIDFPPYVSQVIWRVACISNNHGDAVFWLDDNMFAPGFPATTWGEILGILVDEAFTRGALDWMTRDFDGVLDSDGVTWDTDEFAFQADALMQLGTHVIRDGESAGYEHDITPIAAPVGGFDPGDDTHILHAYNPQGRGDNSEQALVVGAFQTGRIAKRRMPYTVLLLELNDGTHVEFIDPRLVGFPRRERGVRIEQANDATTAFQIADAIFDKEIAGLLATQITLPGESVLPYRDFDIGWIVPHSLGRRALKHDRRVQVIASSYQSNQWVYVVTAAGVVVES